MSRIEHKQNLSISYDEEEDDKVVETDPEEIYVRVRLFSKISTTF